MERQRSNKILFTSPFLEKTYNLLQNSQLEHIISWNFDGTLILINDIEQFAKILPIYFKHKKIQSFIRQLNIYDFKKVKKHISANAFHHPYFKRNDFTKAHLIKRRVKSNKNARIITQQFETQCKTSLINFSESTQKRSSQQQIFNIDQIIQPLQSDCVFFDDGFNYLVNDSITPINHGYYNWEDVFA